VLEAAAGHAVAEGVAAVGAAVVGHDALDGDAVGFEEGECAGKE